MSASQSRVRLSWRAIRRFALGDRAAAITLSAATLAALGWATFSPGSYHHTWSQLASELQVLGLRFTLRDWANQGLMAAFFAIVGLEIRREFSSGELASWRRASVPVAAALGGMAVPAALYALIVHGGAGSRAWGIPMATDVAFAISALALVGARTSPRLRVFLMTLAVADDIASILILVCFYSTHLDVAPLLIGLVCLAVMGAVEAVRPAWIGPQLVVGAGAWWGFARGGVEAAVVGVAIGALALPSPVGGRWARLRGPRGWEQRIAPWLTLLVLPVFALANAGVPLRRFTFSAGGALTVFIAVLAARAAGKPLGITATTWALRRVPSGLYDPRISAHDLLGVGTLAGVGFTVPLLVIRVALPEGALADSATLALLAATLAGALGGIALLHTGTPQSRKQPSPSHPTRSA